MSRNVTRSSNQIIDWHSFHGLISSTEGKNLDWPIGFTIGSSPLDESYVKGPQRHLRNLLCVSVCPCSISRPFVWYKTIWRRLCQVMPRSTNWILDQFLQWFALKMILTLCYAIRMDDAYDELFRKFYVLIRVSPLIVDVGSVLRRASENHQDSIPVPIILCIYDVLDYALLTG